MATSTKRTRSKPEGSYYALRVGLPPAPKWRRRGGHPSDPRRRRSDRSESVQLRLISPGEGCGTTLDR